jgi:uncharacterized membrane protein
MVKAHSEMKKASKYKVAGRIITIISLPVNIAALYTGFPFGAVLTPIGFGLTLAGLVAEKKNSWVMLGTP